jgi:hypothetical protein
LSQSKTQSAVETIINIGSGYVLAILLQLLIFPLYGIQIHLEQNLTMGLMFTVPSVLRSYAIRRLFNRYHVWQLKKSI